ncbi:MAG: tyrosine-type recombinase/integrase [Meiothermus sp.]|nr:tyrosine-type recombinase/integrase [Meiothermus sp.]
MGQLAGLKLVETDTLTALIEAFLDEQSYRGNSKNTLEWYRKVFRILADHGVTRSEHLTREGLVGFIAACRGRGLKPATVANYDRALRVALSWLHANGYIPQNPLAKLPRPKDKTEQVRPFTPDEIARILESCQRRTHSRRAMALVLLLLDTGIRSGEAANLTLRDIDWAEGLIRVNGKTGERVVPFGRRARRALLAYIDRERKVPSPSINSLFVAAQGAMDVESLNSFITRIVRAAGLTRDKVGPHTFRHTFSVEFLKAGGNVFTLQRILGHGRLVTTQRYVNLLTEDVKEAHRRFSPVDRMG